jgi:uncharacterized protein
MRGLILSLFIILLIVPAIYAREGHLTLLAVKENGASYVGTTADLYLEIVKGSGRVFLDTFPLTKVDTQISTRFAKDIACSYLDEDCSRYDFIYTIRADSPIIAGPSAAGAITLLTISLLEGFEVDESISITGTINSGGIVGPVGGIKAKIDAAKQAGLKKVLIPEGERIVEDDREVIETITLPIGVKPIFENSSIQNKTIDLVKYGEKNGLTVVEVSDINDVLYEFTGREFEEQDYELIIDKGYEGTMSTLASVLCNRSNKLLKGIDEPLDIEYNSTMNSILGLTGKAKVAVNSSKHYSAASYCFGANVKLTYLLLSLEKLTEEDIKEKIEIIKKNVINLEKSIDKKEKKTVTDLEAYAIVKERLTESKEYSEEILSTKFNVTSSVNITPNDIYSLAYSFERVYSAFSWANFFDNRGKEFDFGKDSLKSSCQSKIAEAEERYHYVLLFYPILDLAGTRKEIDYAYNDLEDENYELCLFKATKAKAESDVILSVSGVGDDKIANILDRKINAAKNNIAKQINKGNFPVLAYSYYEYADELKIDDKYSALLYSEYALELSNLDMYFKEIRKFPVIRFEVKSLLFLVVGVLLGYSLSKIPKRKTNRKKKTNRKS